MRSSLGAEPPIQCESTGQQGSRHAVAVVGNDGGPREQRSSEPSVATAVVLVDVTVPAFFNLDSNVLPSIFSSLSHYAGSAERLHEQSVAGPLDR